MNVRAVEIIEELKKVIPNPQCELNFKNRYELLCAVLLSAQTTDKRVNLVTPTLFAKYPNFNELKNANQVELCSIIASLGLAKNKTKHLVELATIIVDKYNSEVIGDFKVLTSLPGVGRKTANVVLALGFSIPTFPVDTHISRVCKRLKLAAENDNVDAIEEKMKRKLPKEMWIDAHHLILLFGRYHCKAVNPSCSECSVRRYCRVPRKTETV